MATSAEDYNWAEPDSIPEELKCVVCLSVAYNNPHQHGGREGCGRVFCEDCITRVESDNLLCPLCKRAPPLTTFEDPKTARQIRALKVKCNNLDKGCEWTGEMRDLETHLLSCDYTLLQCENHCNLNSTPCWLLRKDLIDHLLKECPNRPSRCRICNEEMPYCQIDSHMKSLAPLDKHKCPNRKEKCPYRGNCSNIESHLETCEYERVPCRYAELGCTAMPKRKNIKKHEEEDKRQFKVQLDTTLALKNEVSTLNSRISSMNQEIHTMLTRTADTLERRMDGIDTEMNKLRDKMTNLERRTAALESDMADLRLSTEQGQQEQRSVSNLQAQLTRLTEREVPVAPNTAAMSVIRCAPYTFQISNFQYNHTVFESPPFYTSPGGYKMSIKVDANGSGNGRHTHITVSVLLIRGDNDSSITWPFNGSATIELLNQRKDKNHHKNRIPLISMNVGSVQSCTRFIPHTKLERSWRSQYLVNGTLFFRVSVQVDSHKSWLECTQ